MRFCLLLTLLLLSSPSIAFAELYIVSDSSAPLYQELRRVATLHEGEVVQASESRTHDQWLDITHAGHLFSSPKRHFLSKLDLELNERQRSTDFDLKKRQLEHELVLLYTTMESRLQATVQLHRNRTLYQRIDVPRRDPETGAVTITYLYDAVISARSVRQLERDWKDELQEHRTAIAKLRNDLTLLNERELEQAAAFRHLAQRLERYMRHPESWRHDVFMVTERSSRLYQGNDGRGFLRRDDIVIGRQSTRHEDWLVVVQNGEMYQARKSHFANRLDLDLHYQKLRNRLESNVAALESELNLVTAQEKLLRRVDADLAYPRVTHEYIITRPLRLDLGAGSGVEGSTYYLHVPSARRVKRDLDKLSRELAAERNQLFEQLRAEQRKLGTTEAEHERLAQRLTQAWNAFIEQAK